MVEKDIILRCRNKQYSMVISVNSLPVQEKQMASLCSLLDYVRARDDTAIRVRIMDQEHEEDVPRGVMFAESPDGFYMELEYGMSEWNWSHPLLLANDHLTEDEAVSVLCSIFLECTDDDPVVSDSFVDVSSYVYPEE